jgi:hypothetical protein
MEFKETFHTVVKGFIANVTNLNSKRLAVTILFLAISYKILLNGGYGVEPNTIYVAMVGVVGYWMHKESNSPVSSLDIGETTNGHSKFTSVTNATDSPHEAQG